MAHESNKNNIQDNCEEERKRHWIYWVIALILLGLLLLSVFK